jgi:hypothetical protein
MFTAVYLTFGMLVLLTFWYVPVGSPVSLKPDGNTDIVAKSSG